MLDDIDLPGDPYFLKCFRSFHNHELDTGMIVMSDLVEDKDIHRKGPPKVLPQAPLAVVELCSQRRDEIKREIEEREQVTLSYEEILLKRERMGLEPQVEDEELNFQNCVFEQVEKATTIYQVDPQLDRKIQFRIIEPMAFEPQLVIVEEESKDFKLSSLNFLDWDKLDQEEEQNWCPLNSRISFCRDMIMFCYAKVLDQVAVRIIDQRYSLKKWRCLKQHASLYGGLPGHTSYDGLKERRRAAPKKKANNVDKLM